MKSTFTIFLLIFLSASLFASKTGKFNFVLDQGFVKNVGQIKDQYGRTNNSALYLFETQKLSVQLRQNGFSYELKKDNSENESKTAIHRIDVDFVNAHAQIDDHFGKESESKLILISNEDANSARHLTQYSKVVYRNIYPETDLEFLVIPINGEPRFKYNIILRPGADVNKVKLLITGANEVKLLNSGAIEMRTAIGNLEEQVPLSFELNQGGQQGRKITARFKQLGANIFGLNVSRYNSSKTLVIDPMIWSTYFGGTSIEQSGGIIVDKDSNVFISGRTASLTNIATVGSHQSSLASGGGSFDGFLAKFSPTGSLLWATYYGGTGADELQKLALDKGQNIFVTGSSGSSSGIATAGAYQTTNNGTSNGILAKFSQTGNLIWATYFGGTSANPFYDIDIDIFDNITIIGTSSSTSSLNFPNTHQTSVAGLTDIIIAKFNSLGQIKWATYYGGTLNDNALGICSDNNANIYITGNTFSSGGFSTSGAYQVNSAGGSEAYIAKFDSLGKLVYGTFYGGTAAEVGYDIIMDAESKLVITGITSSTAGIATPGAFQTSLTGSAYDGFILKMDTSGIINWCTYFGGTGTDNLYNLASDAASNIYFAGASSSVGLATAGTYQSTLNGTNDALFGKFDKNGALQWASYFGGSSNSESIDRIFLDKGGNLYALGVTPSDGNIATLGAYQTVRKGSADCFVFKFFVGLPIIEIAISNNTLSADQGLCNGSAASKIIGSSPQGGNGTYAYEWLYSSTSAAGTFGIATGVKNGIDYDPIGLSTNGFLKRVVTSGSYRDTSATHSITFGSALNAGFTVNKGIQCLNSNVFVFSDTTASAGPITYFWDFGNGTYGSKQVEQVTFAASKENLHKISLITSLNGACGDTNYAKVFTITNPVLKTINGKDTVLKGTTEIYNVTGSVGSNYNWLFSNGTGRSYTNTLNIKWTQLGDVQLKMIETNSGSCAGDTAIKNIYVKQVTGNQEWFNEGLQIYPNPSEGLIYLDTYEQIKIQVKLFDITIKLLFETEQNSNEPIAIAHLPAGLYLLELTDTNGLFLHKKIQKQ